MIEYTIHHNFTHKELTRLRDEFFPGDVCFFFNFYNGFIRLKLASHNYELDKYITKKGWRWEKNPYNKSIETLPVFKRNFDMMCEMLHCFSVMILKEKDIAGVQNRVIHLFMNMRKRSYKQEAEELVVHALRYSKIDGIYEGINKAREISR